MATPMTPPRATLSARGLACLRGGRLVFRGLDLDLAGSEALTLRGPNGSGKSSLLRLLAGLLRPSEGQILWNGAAIDADRDAHRARVANLGMADALKPSFTVAENIAFHAAIRGAGEAAARQALTAVGLAPLADMPARRLSQGQRRRTALARLAASDATLWLLDEPTLALDDAAIAMLGRMLGAHLETGGMAVVATHVDLPVASVGTIDFGAAR
jgi:heme exporter protein A